MRLLLAVLTAMAAPAAAGVPSPSASPAALPSGAPVSAQAIVARMMACNPSLQTYEARVHVNVRLLSFPYVAPKLDGTSYYKRPDTYVVVFDRVPGYAKGFSRLFDDVGDPQAWERDQNITVNGKAWLHGRPMIVLRLTKKIHSDVLDHTLAYVDASSYMLVQMEWYYTNGGKITMSEQYRAQGPYTVLSSQHATIHIPYVHAVADASYGKYQTNVAVASPGSPEP